MPRAVLLFTGSLDSMLAARLLADQGIEIDALFVQTPWNCGHRQPDAGAAALGLPLTTVSVAADYCEPLRAIAREGASPTRFCGDCHLHLACLAAERRQAVGADFVATGDVLGQRAANQKRRDFDRFAHHSGLGDRLVWPLSAQRLTVSLPERQGWLDRSRLGAFCGRRRVGLSALASQLGLPPPPTGTRGCPLGQTGSFGARVVDQIDRGRSCRPGDIALLGLGTHWEVDASTRVILGRRQAENEMIERLWQAGDTDGTCLLRPDGFAGPTALIVGPATPAALGLARSSILRYAKHPPGGARAVLAVDREGTQQKLADGEYAGND